VGFELACSPELARLFAELGLSEAVLCEGILPSERVRPFYRAARVLVVPSAYEGLPMVVLEALQCGLPCVATRVSGHPEAIEEGESGFLVDPDDPEQLAERCLRILADPGLARRMGEAGRARVAERFGLARQLSQYLELYQRLAAGPSRDRRRGRARRGGAGAPTP
jgi:glycosyltransferase involved in cell wall biosynthesis